MGASPRKVRETARLIDACLFILVKLSSIWTIRGSGLRDGTIVAILHNQFSHWGSGGELECQTTEYCAKRYDRIRHHFQFDFRFGLLPLVGMKIPGLRTADELVGGIVHFGRMLDKIRLKANGTLPEGYFLGDEDSTWWDSRCCRFLRVNYNDLAAGVREGMDDSAALEWCFSNGRRPAEDDISLWNTFILKRGWRDESTPGLQADKEAGGFGDRDDILTYIDLFRVEEA